MLRNYNRLGNVHHTLPHQILVAKGYLGEGYFSVCVKYILLIQLWAVCIVCIDLIP